MNITFKSNRDTVRRNFHAKKRGIERALQPIVIKWGRIFYNNVHFNTPRRSGTMARLLRLRFTARKLNFSVGWWESDFAAEGERFYPMYVVLGTSRTPANPILTVAENQLRPQFRADFARELNDFISRRRAR